MPPAAPPELNQVLYVSRVRLTDIAQVRRLHETCQRNNQKQGLTGLLLCTGGHFAQLLEGPPTALSETMWRIAADDRHSQMRKLFAKPVTRRMFPGWSMKLLVNQEADEQVRDLLEAPQPAIHEVAALLAHLQGTGDRARAL